MTEVETVIASFGKHLTESWKRKQTPHRLESAYAYASKLPVDATERIFLEVGFKPWLTYFLTAKIKGRNFDGRAEVLRAIALLHELPTKRQEEIASRLFNTPAHPTVEEKIEELSRRCQSSKLYNKRRFFGF